MCNNGVFFSVTLKIGPNSPPEETSELQEYLIHLTPFIQNIWAECVWGSEYSDRAWAMPAWTAIF